jgi:hypothetical protein
MLHVSDPSVLALSAARRRRRLKPAAAGRAIEGGSGGGGSPGQIALETIRGRKRGFDPQLQDPARIIWFSNRCINLKFYWQRTPKNPDQRRVAAGKLLAIGWFGDGEKFSNDTE